MSVQAILTWLAVGFQAVAALLWWGSTIVKVSAKQVVAEYQEKHGNSWSPAQIVDSEDGSDVIASAERQSRWSRWAAIVTAIGVGLQAIATAMAQI